MGTSPHIGIDYRASIGTPVYSFGNGTVVDLGKMRSGIQYVTIEYENGDKVRFLHLSKIDPKLKVNEMVYEGQIIGLSGNSGTYKGKDGKYHNYPAHLHVDAVDKNGNKISPELNNYGTVTNKEFFEDYNGDYLQLSTKNKTYGTVQLPEIIVTGTKQNTTMQNGNISNEKNE